MKVYQITPSDFFWARITRNLTVKFKYNRNTPRNPCLNYIKK